MALDPALLKMAEDWLRKKCPNHVCSACSQTQWVIGDMVTMFVYPGCKPDTHSFDTGTDTGLKAASSVFCAHCGHRELFSAAIVENCV